MNSKRLFVAGVPATGKSYFGNWLEKHHGYVHFDPEQNSRLTEKGLNSAWHNIATTGAIGLFSYLVSRIPEPVVLNWGFPPARIEAVDAIKACGFTLCWLDGDWDTARAEFIERNKRSAPEKRISVECFDIQRNAVLAKWSRIEDLFGANVIGVLTRDGSRLAPELIYDRIEWA